MSGYDLTTCRFCGDKGFIYEIRNKVMDVSVAGLCAECKAKIDSFKKVSE